MPACVICFYALKSQLLYPADNVILIPARPFKRKSCCSQSSPLIIQEASSWAVLGHRGSDGGGSAAVCQNNVCQNQPVRLSPLLLEIYFYSDKQPQEEVGEKSDVKPV